MKVTQIYTCALLATILCAPLLPAGVISIQPVTLSGKTFELCEFKLSVDSKGLNPFRQSEFAVDADFTLPSGIVMRVPAFFSQDYAHSNHNGVLVPGSAGWHIRFSGAEAGTYQFTVMVREKGRLTSEKPGPAFALSPSTNHGMIRIARRAPRYLEYDDGQSFFPIGQNVCFTTDISKIIDPKVKSPVLPWDTAFANWFGKMKSNRANWARVWMKPNFYLEGGNPWEWSLENVWRFDQVLEMARQNGIYLCVCMNPERRWASEYLDAMSFGTTAYGQLLAARSLGSTNFTTDAQCREMYRDKLRYLVARWGYSPNIAHWEFWNEIECLEAEDPAAWSKDMTAYLRSVDPWKHIVKSSSHKDTPSYWTADCGDLNDIHGYYGWQGTNETKNFGSFLDQYSTNVYNYGRPFIIAETGIAREVNGGSCGRDADADTTGFHVHECLWGGLFSGSVGAGMPWWWDENIDKPNVYWRFQAIANFVKDVRFNRENFLRGTEATAGGSLKIYELIGQRTRLLWVRHPDLSWYGVAVEKKVLTPIRQATLSLAGFIPGDYTVELWSSELGKLLSRSAVSTAKSTLAVALPDIETELAIKIIRQTK